jgi:hypothetical protein
MINIKVFALVSVFALTACSPMKEHKIEGLDNLKIVEHRDLNCIQTAGHCFQSMTLFMKLIGAIPLGCATINFPEWQCDTWACSTFGDGIWEHERVHCGGYDHYGEVDRTFITWKKDRPWNSAFAEEKSKGNPISFEDFFQAWKKESPMNAAFVEAKIKRDPISFEDFVKAYHPSTVIQTESLIPSDGK